MISIVTTARDEEGAIPSLCQSIDRVMRGLGRPWELILIDDGSTDGTWAAIRGQSSANPGLRAFRLRRNRGKAFALRVAFAQARGSVIVTLDADLQDDPEDIPRLLRRLDEGLDLVVGWRSPRADTGTKRFSSAVYNAAVNALSGLRVHDHNCGLKALRAEAARHLALYGDFHRYMVLLACREGFRVGEEKTRHHPRPFGRSKYGFTRLLTAPMDLFSLIVLMRYQHQPLRLFGSLGAASAAVGTGLMAWLAVVWCLGNAIGHRPLLIYATVLVITGVQLVSLGVVAELIVWNAGGPAGHDPATAIAEAITK